MPQHRASRAPRFLVAAVTLVLAVALGGCGDDAQEPQSAASSSSVPEASSSPTRDQGSASPTDGTGTRLAVRIDGDDVSPMAETMELSTGDVLTVEVDANRAGELHVHSSPEQYVEFGDGTTRQRIAFDKPGQVDIEEHQTGVLVARVLVS